MLVCLGDTVTVRNMNNYIGMRICGSCCQWAHPWLDTRHTSQHSTKVCPGEWQGTSGPFHQCQGNSLQIVVSEAGQPTWTGCIGRQLTPPYSTFLPTLHKIQPLGPTFTCVQNALAVSSLKQACYHKRAEKFGTHDQVSHTSCFGSSGRSTD